MSLLTEKNYNNVSRQKFDYIIVDEAHVFSEAVAPTLHPSGLDGEDKVVVVLAVEVRHEVLLVGEALVDKKILFIVAHWVAKIDIYTVEGSGVLVADDRFVWDATCVIAEVCNMCRDF